MSRVPLRLAAVAVPQQPNGSWNRIEVRLSGAAGSFLPFAILRNAGGQEVGSRVYLRPGAAPCPGTGPTHAVICFLPEEVTSVEIGVLGPGAVAVRAAGLRCQPMPRWRAAVSLLSRRPRALLGLLAQPLSLRPHQLPGRFRRILAHAAREQQIIEPDYAAWITLFDSWAREDFEAAPELPIGFLVLAREPDSAALRATVASLEGQYAPVRFAVLRAGDALAGAVAGLDATYVGILQAGEVLPPHAALMAARQLDHLGQPEIAITDEDALSAAGERHSPAFKPVPNEALMLSGTLSRGLWLVRPATLLAHGGGETGWAEALRLRLWLARHRVDGTTFSARIPFILCHRRPDTEAAPPAALAAVVERHLRGGGPAILVRPTWPLSFGIRPGETDAPVTVVIPSTLRRPHSVECITAILRGTDYDALELHVAVSQPGPLDDAQRRAAAAIEAFPRARVTKLDAGRFNFSWVNNQIIARTGGENVLLLNDDVSPIRPDWLRWMAAFLRDPGVGMVGARLLYPSGLVQHGGVIMGLAGLCDHAHRYLPAKDPGYMGRAVLAQELSAVTAACMLVRRRLLEQVGGLNEDYPSAFNDVDLALRVGELGYSVVYAPQAELHHHELQTYGSHYAGDRQPFQKEEVRRMRARWAAVCAADPFHNPNLGLEPGLEWKPAFPPRSDPALPRGAEADPAEAGLGQASG